MRILIVLGLLLGLCGQVDAAEHNVKAWAHCPMTHVTGHGQGATFTVAVDAAIKDCLAKGGMPGCCPKFTGDESTRPGPDY
jgi:hypothetical protein